MVSITSNDDDDPAGSIWNLDSDSSDDDSNGKENQHSANDEPKEEKNDQEDPPWMPLSGKSASTQI